MNRARACAVALLTAFTLGCGETPAPTSPTNMTAFFPTLGGPWVGSLQLTGVFGGECVGAVYDARRVAGTGNDAGTVTIAQTGTDVTATVRSATDGGTCTYEGTTGINLFALSATSCDAREIYFQCPDGRTRVLDFVGSTMTATPSGGAASGVVATSYNVSELDTGDLDEKKPLAGLTLQYAFSARRP